MNGAMGEPQGLEVKKNGQLLLACGGVKSITSGFAKFSGATLQIYDSGNCTQEGSLYEVAGVNFTIAPSVFGDNCFDARIEWAPSPPCEVTGFALSNGDDAVYVGAFGRTTGPSGYEAFSAKPIFDCGCAIDGEMCCSHLFELDQATYSPGRYTLGFPNAKSDIGPEETIIGSVDGNDYQFKNFRSFVQETCDDTPSHVWLDVRWWAMKAN